MALPDGRAGAGLSNGEWRMGEWVMGSGERRMGEWGMRLSNVEGSSGGVSWGIRRERPANAVAAKAASCRFFYTEVAAGASVSALVETS